MLKQNIQKNVKTKLSNVQWLELTNFNEISVSYTSDQSFKKYSSTSKCDK